MLTYAPHVLWEKGWPGCPRALQPMFRRRAFSSVLAVAKGVGVANGEAGVPPHSRRCQRPLLLFGFQKIS